MLHIASNLVADEGFFIYRKKKLGLPKKEWRPPLSFRVRGHFARLVTLDKSPILLKRESVGQHSCLTEHFYLLWILSVESFSSNSSLSFWQNENRNLSNALGRGKSLSETLIFASTNPQYDDRAFIELQVQYIKIPSSEHCEKMLCTEVVFDIQNN